MRKILILLLSLVLIFSVSPVAFADSADGNTTTEIEYLDDGSCFVTTIEVSPPGTMLRAATSTKNGSKTIVHQSASGTTLWSVKVSGSFSYNGTTSSCTSSTVTATANSSVWKIASKTASKSGNTATASATAKLYSGSDVVQTITKTATLTCNKNGNLS
jgi:hypothetical protein